MCVGKRSVECVVHPSGGLSARIIVFFFTFARCATAHLGEALAVTCAGIEFLVRVTPRLVKPSTPRKSVDYYKTRWEGQDGDLVIDL